MSISTSTSKNMTKLVLSSLVALALSSNAFAANVPEGTVLADKQEVIFQATAETPTYDPQKVDDTFAGLIDRQLFEGLLDVDAEGKVIPAMAERWESSPDFKVWTYHLRHNGKWSNGDPVTAHDFVYAWQRLVDPKTASNYATYLSFMKVANVEEIVEGKKPTSELGVKALDDYTFQITLTESVPFAAELIPNAALYPVHKATVEKYGDEWTNPKNIVSNGPYIIGDRVLNEKLVLVRNPMYWDNQHTVIDKSTYVITTDSAGIARYRAGEFDMAYVPETTYKNAKFKKEYADQIASAKKLGTFTYVFNTLKAPFNDVRVRKALDLAVERDVIAYKVMGFGQLPAYTYTPPYIEGAQKMQAPDYANWTQAQRNEEAKKLLQEAGYSKEKPLKSELLYSTNEGLKNISVATVSMWKKNLDGMVDIGLKNQEWKTFVDTKNERNFFIAFDAWTADYNDASTYLTVYLSNNSYNRTGFKDPKYDELVHSAYRAKTNDERYALYAEAEKVLTEHHPFVPVYYYASLYVQNPKLKGFEGKNPMGGYAIKEMYLVK